MSRSQRRYNDAIKKEAARRKLLRNLGEEPSAPLVGRAAAIHNTCPCWACTSKEPERTRQIFADLIKLHADE